MLTSVNDLTPKKELNYFNNKQHIILKERDESIFSTETIYYKPDFKSFTLLVNLIQKGTYDTTSDQTCLKIKKLNRTTLLSSEISNLFHEHAYGNEYCDLHLLRCFMLTSLTIPYNSFVTLPLLSALPGLTYGNYTDISIMLPQLYSMTHANSKLSLKFNNENQKAYFIEQFLVDNITFIKKKELYNQITCNQLFVKNMYTFSSFTRDIFTEIEYTLRLSKLFIFANKINFLEEVYSRSVQTIGKTFKTTPRVRRTSNVFFSTSSVEKFIYLVLLIVNITIEKKKQQIFTSGSRRPSYIHLILKKDSVAQELSLLSLKNTNLKKKFYPFKQTLAKTKIFITYHNKISPLIELTKHYQPSISSHIQNQVLFSVVRYSIELVIRSIKEKNITIEASLDISNGKITIINIIV